MSQVLQMKYFCKCAWKYKIKIILIQVKECPEWHTFLRNSEYKWGLSLFFFKVPDFKMNF